MLFSKIHIKKHLTNQDYANTIAMTIDFLFKREDDSEFESISTLPYYILKPMAINSIIVNVYSDYVLKEDEDTYKIIRKIYRKCDKKQFNKLMKDIEDAIQYELARQPINMFGDMGDADKTLDKFNEIIDRVGEDNFLNLLKVGVQDEAIKNAQSEIAKERKNNKKK